MTAAFDEFREQDEQTRICERCGKDKTGVEKRPNKERLCACCWAALNCEPIDYPTRQNASGAWER